MCIPFRVVVVFIVTLALCLTSNAQTHNQVTIHINDKFVGNGVLINDSCVLTAGHVLFESRTKEDTVKLNNQTVILHKQLSPVLAKPESIYVQFEDKKYFIPSYNFHPQFDTGKVSYGIDLVRLKVNVSMVPELPIYKNCLSTGSKGIMAGFLVSETKTLISNRHKVMIDSVIPLLSDSFEQLMSVYNKHRDESGVLVGGLSGSGLYLKDNRQWHLVGIASRYEAVVCSIENNSFACGRKSYWICITAMNDWLNADFD